MHRQRPRITPVIVLAGALCGACSDPKEPPATPQPAQVTVAQPLVRDAVEWERYTGRLQPVEQVDIKARVSGYLKSAHFAEGQMVRQGDLLVTIDPRPFEVAVASALAALGEARANLRRAEAQRAQAVAERDVARSAEEFAKARLDNAREVALAEAITREQVEARESEYAQAQAQLAAGNAAIAGADADIATADAAVLAAEAALDAAELDLEYTELHAPITGRISRLLVTRGNLVQGGSGNATLLTTIVSTDPIYVHIEASEQELLRYLRNATLEERLSNEFRHPFFLRLMDESGYPHRGQIDFAENRVDQSTGTLLVRGILRNPDLVLIPGVFATVQIPSALNRNKTAVLIPDEAIVADQVQRLVMTVSDDNTVVPLPIELGPMIDGLRVVRSGLAGDERIIISGLQRAIPGVEITPNFVTIEPRLIEDGLPGRVAPVPRADWILAPSGAGPEDAE